MWISQRIWLSQLQLSNEKILMMIRKITVIGGSGFVGTNLCRQFHLKKQDFEIIDLKKSNQFPEKCKIGDVRDLESLRATISGDVVINLAAVHRDNVRDKTEYERTNVHGTQNVARVCTEKGIKKIIFTSSVAVYGFAEPGTAENGKINPFNAYGRTKFDAEEKLRDWQVSTGSSLIIVRPTVIFGEGNRGNVYNLLNQVASGKFLMIGPGDNKKSMAYILNVVAFLEKCILADVKYGVYNYVDTPDLTMNELVSQVRRTLTGRDGVGLRLPFFLGIVLGYLADGVARITGVNLPVSAIRVRKFVSTTEFKSSWSQLEGFRPRYTLKESIDRTLDAEFINPDPNREIFYSE